MLETNGREISRDEIVMRRISLENPQCTIPVKDSHTRATSFALNDKVSDQDGPSWSRLSMISPNDLIECGRLDGATQKQTIAFAIASVIESLGFTLEFRPENCDKGHFVLLSKDVVSRAAWSKLANKTLVLPIEELQQMNAGENPVIREKLVSLTKPLPAN